MKCILVGSGSSSVALMFDGTKKPIGYAFRTLNEAEKKYSQFGKEGLTCIFGLPFHQYVHGRHFTLITNNKPLLGLYNENKAVPAHASVRIQCWAFTLAAYVYSLCYRTSLTC